MHRVIGSMMGRIMGRQLTPDELYRIELALNRVTRTWPDDAEQARDISILRDLADQISAELQKIEQTAMNVARDLLHHG